MVDASTAHQSRKVSVLSQVDQLLDMEELLDVAMDIREGSSHSSLRDSLRRSGSTRTIELRTKPRPVHTNLAEPGGNRCRRGSEFAKLTDPLEQMRNMHAFDTLPLDAARTLPVLPSVVAFLAAKRRLSASPSAVASYTQSRTLHATSPPSRGT
ncbi:hypothetical protein C8T65DRAFT_742386 [Cerioporus squamosus]|nr:hypothetical protein C8T65DRAFT_742386 [Cerioporus squamosus]